MPISFACPTCGVTLKVPDTLAGKTGRCPKCGKSTKAPGGDGEAAPAAVKKANVVRDSPPAAADDDIVTEAVDDDVITEPVEEEEPAKPLAKTKRVDNRPGKKRRDEKNDADDDRPRRRKTRDDEDEELDDEDDDRPPKLKRKFGKKKKRKGRLILWLSLAGGGVVLLGGVALLLWMLGVFGGGIDKHWLPDDVTHVTVTNYDAGRSSGLYKKLLADFGDAAKEFGLEGESYGIKLDDVSYLVTASAEKKESITLYYLKKAMTEEEVAKAMSKNAFEKETVGKYTVHYEKFASGNAFVMPQSRLIIRGPRATLKNILERNGPAKMSDDMKKALGKISTGYVSASADVYPNAKENTPVYRYHYESAGSNSTTRTEVREFKSNEEAEKAKKTFEENRSKLKEKHGTTTASVSGSTLTIKNTITYEELKSLFEKFKK